jgi:glycerophosphoryl diester phosphodiesterase
MSASPLIIAHRGLPKSAPENTLPSFLAALKHRPDVVECDYRHSIDDVLIVIHDDALDRTTDSLALFGKEKLSIGAKQAADLRRLDAGAWFNPTFAKTRLPTLEETIDAVCPHAKLMIERKAGEADSLVELLRRKDCFERVVVQAFEWSFIAECHRLEPRITLGALGGKELTSEKIDEAQQIGAMIVGWDQRDLTSAGIAAAHAKGMKVWSWTVNKPERARELTAAGIDGIITDRCDVVRDWIR